MLIQNVSSTPASFASEGGAPVVAHPAGPPAVKVPQERAVQPTEAQLKSAVDAINRAMKQNNANVEFSIDKDTRQTVIKVVETGSGNVIRQFPTEEILAVSRMIAEAQRGILLKQQA